MPTSRSTMKKKKSTALRCPTCNKIVLLDGEDVPFCSDRCRRIDLGKWASGDYKISSPILDPDVLEGLSEEHRRPQQDGDDE
jgi:endogenous inhibitor of DNA gyrase (YacG/DUF329 family)